LFSNLHRAEPAPTNPFDEGLVTSCFSAGSNYYCKGEGCNNTGSVWGSGPYTYDSPMCQCARHSGIIDPTSGGIISFVLF
jgi:hypothetical protein